MSTRIEMPELSSDGAADGEGAALATWLVSVGDRVEKGDVIAEIETDKSTLELEAPATGTIARLDVEEGAEDIAAGTLLGLLDADGDDADDADGDDADGAEGDDAGDADDGDGGEAPSSKAAPSPRETSGATQRAADTTASGSEPTASPGEASGRHEATPLARRAARAHDVDLGSVVGTGPKGRVVEEDVLRSAAPEAEAGPAPAEEAAGEEPASAPADEAASPQVNAEANEEEAGRRVPLSAMRRTIARRMTEAKQQVPHFYLRVRCPMDALLEARAALNRELESAGRDVRLSVNDFVVRAMALALRDVSEANVRFAGRELILLERVDVAVAVATEGGLVTPVVRDADRKGLAALAEEVRSLATRAREGRLERAEYEGGSCTVSNLGMYGVETVYPIVNPPQACILGVGAVEEVPVVRDGGIEIGRRAAFTLAADHRAIDGAVGARLLAALRGKLEDPLSMLF